MIDVQLVNVLKYGIKSMDIQIFLQEILNEKLRIDAPTISLSDMEPEEVIFKMLRLKVCSIVCIDNGETSGNLIWFFSFCLV